MELKLPKTLIDDVSENELKLYDFSFSNMRAGMVV